ncbi:translation initiation factor IF-2 [bacterium]|nr:MAG: translation initiation factor IF-2 [bacterium]
MAKRIYEKARELGVESKELLKMLQDMGFEPKTASSSCTEKMEKALAEKLGEKATQPEKQGEKEPIKEKETAEDTTRKARRDAILKKIGMATGAKVSKRITVEVEPEPKTAKPKTEVPKTVEVETRPKRKDRKKLKPLRVIEHLSPRELAEVMSLDVKEVLRACMAFGVMATANQRLDLDVIETVAEELGFFAILVDEDEFRAPPEVEKVEEPEKESEKIATEDEKPEPKKPKKKKKKKKEHLPGEIKRPPVVTVMGHVDHGKTTLLDYIRKTNVVAGEKGGITQHIGAYSVETEHGKITFVDTPGHEAFTAIRARGADITDIVVLVISQDDGVMPQTKEAIRHAKAADVPIIVAINKMDLPGASSEKVKNELALQEVMVEDWGGDVLCADISALTGEGVEQLLELISLQAEMMELSANPEGAAEGVVVEALLDKFRGATATILVKKGTLKQGDSIVAGSCPGRVRSMEDERGKRLEEAGPSTPVVITGLNCVPQAGEPFKAVKNDIVAREIAEKRRAEDESKREGVAPREAMTLEDFYALFEGGKTKELNIVLKTDVDGSAEAIRNVLENLGNEEVGVKLINVDVGDISENDVLLAKASDGVVLGFNVKPDNRAKKAAKHEKVDIKLYSVIYELEADVRAALEGLLEPEVVENKIGVVEIKEIFRIPRVGDIAGCVVREGAVRRGAKIEIVRAEEVIGQAEVKGLKRYKDDVKEVAEGVECGIEIGGFKDFKVGDILNVIEVEKITRRLEK